MIEERGSQVTDADRALSRQFGKDYFDEDPKRAVEEYLAKKAEEKKGKK